MDQGGEKKGLLRFFSQCTREEYEEQCRREAEKSCEGRNDAQQWHKVVDAEKKIMAREGARLRQQKRRSIRKKSEIAQGLRSPGGTKVNLKRKAEVRLQFNFTMSPNINVSTGCSNFASG